MVQKKITLPIYRSLYLNHLLEERQELNAQRDKAFRSLVQSFSAIRDSDWAIPPSLGAILRPYQAYGYKWLRTLYESGFGGILADEMGLGKTLEMIALLKAVRDEKEDFRALIVCPASLIFNWAMEIERFEPSLKVSIVHGTALERGDMITGMKSQKTEASPDVYVTSYDLLRNDILQYKEVSFTICVLDEAQFIKNHTALVSKAVKLIESERRFALTGTPIENRLAELWSIFDFLMPGFLYDKKKFQESFEEPIMKKRDQEVTQRLRNMTAPFILRRRKEEVLKDLPPKMELVQYFTMDTQQRHLYDAQVIEMKNILDQLRPGQNRMHVFAALTRLRQICCDPSLYLPSYKGESVKRSGCLELIESAIDGGHRILVFSQFTSMFDLLTKDLKKAQIPYMMIVGSTPKEKRLTMVQDFNEGDVPVFLISLKAGGTGLNLTGADTVIHYDSWWNVAVQNQAMDRTHRIGQSRSVTVYKLICQNTVEERILELQENKKDLAESVLSGDASSLFNLSVEELFALLE